MSWFCEGSLRGWRKRPSSTPTSGVPLRRPTSRRALRDQRERALFFPSPHGEGSGVGWFSSALGFQVLLLFHGLGGMSEGPEAPSLPLGCFFFIPLPNALFSTFLFLSKINRPHQTRCKPPNFSNRISCSTPIKVRPLAFICIASVRFGAAFEGTFLALAKINRLVR